MNPLLTPPREQITEIISSARSLIDAIPLGEMKPINERQIEELRRKFLPE
jgi:hypothetical protein